jgi:hypothetical protein
MTSSVGDSMESFDSEKNEKATGKGTLLKVYLWRMFYQVHL